VTLTQSDVGELRGRPDALTRQPNPALRDAVGVGVDIVSTLLIAAGDKRTSRSLLKIGDGPTCRYATSSGSHLGVTASA
jgi:hypothetical protein